MKKTGRVLRRCLAAQILIALSFLSAHAQNHEQFKAVKVILDPAQTEIRWKLSGGLHTTHGTFKLKTGQMVFNPQTGVAEGEILVDATTGQSGDAARDKRMQNEVLESNRYPAIFFHPTAIKGSFESEGSPQDLSAEGTFNIHGADHPLQMPLHVQVSAGVVTATAHFTIPYVDWGMKNPSRLLFRVSKQVEIEVAAKGTVNTVH